MNILCLDLEGVLVPEVWQAVASKTGVDALQKTTRDIPVYTDLMDYRLEILASNDIRMSQIQQEIDTLDPLEGAVEFLQWAREHFQVAIISDTFYEFAAPLMRKLGQPFLLCHRLSVEDDRITAYHIRQPDPKRRSVQAFKSLQYTVCAAGDSYNDVTMLEEADHGFFYQAPAKVCEEFPAYPKADDYEQLQALLLKAIQS